MPSRDRYSKTKYYNPTQRRRDKYNQKSKQTRDSPILLSSTMTVGVTISATKRKRDHFVLRFERSDEPTKTALLEEHRRMKRARTEEPREEKNKIARIVEMPFSPPSPLFRASFVEGLVETNVMVDRGADADIIPA